MDFLTQQSDAVDEGYSWIILIAAGWLTAVVYGIIHISSVFFNVWLEKFDESTHESASWILTIPMLLFYLLSPLVSTTWRKLRSAKAVSLAALLLMPLSLLLSSYVYEYRILFLTHSLLLGFGITCVVPCNVMVVRYFNKHMPIALATVTSCTYLGSFTLLPLTNYLLERYNWRVAMRWLSFISLVTGAPSVFLFREHTSDQNPSCGNNFATLFKSARFWVVMASFAVLSIEYQTLSTHLIEYAYEIGISDINNIRMVPAYVAVGNIAGRMFIGFFMSKVSRKLLFYKITLIITSLCACMGMYCRSIWQMVVFLVLYGFFEGGSKAQMALVIVLTLGEKKFTEAYALIMMFQTFFMVSGPVIVGKVVDETGNYMFMIYVLTGVPVLATLILQCLVFFKDKRNKMEKNDKA